MAPSARTISAMRRAGSDHGELNRFTMCGRTCDPSPSTHGLRRAQVAARMADTERALHPVAADHPANPAHERRETAGEAVEEREVHERPDRPCGEPTQPDPAPTEDGAESPDGGDAPQIP